MAQQRMPPRALPATQPISDLLEQLSRGGMEGGPRRRQVSGANTAGQTLADARASVISRASQGSGGGVPREGIHERNAAIGPEAILALQDPPKVDPAIYPPNTTPRLSPSLEGTTAVGTPLTGLTDVYQPFGPEGLGEQFLDSPTPGHPDVVHPRSLGDREAGVFKILTEGIGGTSSSGERMGGSSLPDVGSLFQVDQLVGSRPKPF
jgi:hypothetical protein